MPDVIEATPDALSNQLADKGIYVPGKKMYKRRFYPFRDRQAYAAAGQLSTSFFITGPTPFRTICPGNGSLPTNFQFLFERPRVRIVQGVTVAGAAAATGLAFAANSAVPGVIAEQMRLITDASSQIIIKVGETTVWESFGLSSVPWGGGAVPRGGLDGSVTGGAGSHGGLLINNGIEDSRNGNKLSPPWLIPPQTPFTFQVNFETLMPLTGGGAFEVVMEGTLITPPNL